jgi:hypothetical protein
LLLHNDFHGGYPRALWHTGASPNIVNGQTWLNGSAVDGTTTNRPRTMSVVSIVTTGGVRADQFGSGNTSGRYWRGDLAELIIYDQPLNGTDRKAVEDYLALKYGLYVPTVGTPTISRRAGDRSRAPRPSTWPRRRRARRSTTRPTTASPPALPPSTPGPSP